MNGAQALIRTLVASGVDTCFANPGTSEMHFVAALDTVPEMRAVLGLFEGVVTGAAGTAPSPHDTSAGRTSVATRPGGDRAAATASAASRGSAAVEADVRTQAEVLRASDSMSDVSGAS